MEPLWIVEMFFCGYCTTNCASGLVDEKSKKENIFLDLQKRKICFSRDFQWSKREPKKKHTIYLLMSAPLIFEDTTTALHRMSRECTVVYGMIPYF